MYALELAVDDLSRARGLGGRTSVPDDGGMLFVFPEAAERTFWMKDCLTDIDIMFLGPTGRVLSTEVMIANARVQAPFDGTVTRKFLDTGDLASPGRVLFSIEDSSLLRLEIHVAESLASKVSLGDTFRVRVDGAAADLQGKVGEISPAADPGSRTFLVKLDLEKDPALRAGQFGRAYLPRGRRQALRVPADAIFQRRQMDYVFVAEDGVARLRIVRTLDGSGQAEATTMPREILAGVEEGETIILSPPPGLRDGQSVDISANNPSSGDPAGKPR